MVEEKILEEKNKQKKKKKNTNKQKNQEKTTQFPQANSGGPGPPLPQDFFKIPPHSFD